MAAYSYVIYPYKSSQPVYILTFPYLSRAHVHVFIGDVELSEGTHYEWLTDSSINVLRIPNLDDIPVSEDPPFSYTLPDKDRANIYIQRVTPRNEPVTDFQDGSTLHELELDEQVLQLLYIVQESYDIIAYLKAIAGSAKDAAESAARACECAEIACECAETARRVVEEAVRDAIKGAVEAVTGIADAACECASQAVAAAGQVTGVLEGDLSLYWSYAEGTDEKHMLAKWFAMLKDGIADLTESLKGYLPLSGGTLTGNLTINGTATGKGGFIGNLNGNAATAKLSEKVKATTMPNTSAPLMATRGDGTTPVYDPAVKLGANPGEVIANIFAGNLNGNAATATKLKNPVSINGVPFDGTGSITLPTPQQQGGLGNGAVSITRRMPAAVTAPTNGTSFLCFRIANYADSITRFDIVAGGERVDALKHTNDHGNAVPTSTDFLFIKIA